MSLNLSALLQNTKTFRLQPIAVQNWHIDDKSGQISIDFEGSKWTYWDRVMIV